MAPRDTPLQQPTAAAAEFPAQAAAPVAQPKTQLPGQTQGRLAAAVMFSNDPQPRAGVQQAVNAAVTAHPIVRAQADGVRIEDAPLDVGHDSFTFHLRNQLSQNAGATSTLLVSLLTTANQSVQGAFFNCNAGEIDALSLKLLIENFITAVFGSAELVQQQRTVIALDRGTLQQTFPGAVIAPDITPLLRDETHAPPLDEADTERRLAMTRELRKKTKQTSKIFGKLIKEERQAREALMKEERKELAAFVSSLEQDRHDHSHQSKELRRYTKRLHKVEKDFSKQEKSLGNLAMKSHKSKLGDKDAQMRVEQHEQGFRQLADDVHASNAKLRADETQMAQRADQEQRYAEMLGKEASLVHTYSDETTAEEKKLFKERKAAASHAKEGLHQEEKRLKSEEKAMKKQLKDAKTLHKEQAKGNRLPIAGVQSTSMLNSAQLFPQRQFASTATSTSKKSLPMTIRGGTSDAIASACRAAAALSIGIVAQAHERGFLKNYPDTFEHIGFPVSIAVDLHEVLAPGTSDNRLYQPAIGFVTVPVTFATTLLKSHTSASGFAKAAQVERLAAALHGDVDRRIARGEALRNALYPARGDASEAPLFRVLYLGPVAQASRHNIKCFFETSDGISVLCWLGDRNQLNLVPASNFPLDMEAIRQFM